MIIENHYEIFHKGVYGGILLLLILLGCRSVTALALSIAKYCHFTYFILFILTMMKLKQILQAERSAVT
jgi:hypothetical protein